jgi:aspartate ammonia-lyase
MSNAQTHFRIERDLLGEREIPADALHGIHTARALDAFDLAGEPVDRDLVKAMGSVKLACARANRSLGAWPDNLTADAIEQACRDRAGIGDRSGAGRRLANGTDGVDNTIAGDACQRD